MTLPDSGIFTDTSTTNGQAKQAQDDILEEVRTIKTGSAGALQASNNLADVDDAPTALGNLGGEPADADILKADTPSYLQTVYSNKYQVHTGNSLAGFTPTSNCILWSLTEDSTLDELTFEEETHLEFHVIPNGHSLDYASAYVQYCDDFSSSAPGVKIGVSIIGDIKSTSTIVGR